MNKQKQSELLELIRQEYESGKEYKRRIGLSAKVSENERFYRGDQWYGVAHDGLPAPTFNMIRRVVNYLVSAVMSYRIDIQYSDPALAVCESSPALRNTEQMLEFLSSYRTSSWERQGIDRLLRQALTDAILTGDGIFYAWYDPHLTSCGESVGDIRLSVIDNVNLFAADMNLSDIQSQDYLLLVGRCSVKKLRREALARGIPESEVRKIVPDDPDFGAGDYSESENGDQNAAKATYFIRFTRDDDGYVVFDKCTSSVVLQSVRTGLRRYPVAMFCWEPAKNSFHGSSPISELIGNQKYVNKAFAMEMKHMMDTAFSKIIYDKRLIPEWSNEVGQAIGVLSGGDVSGAVTTVGVGQMQEGYIDIIDRVITYTKEMSGATESVLGEVDPTNTSAIITLKEAADQPLDHIRSRLYCCVEELAMIWLEMQKEYLPKIRKVAHEERILPLNLDLVDVGRVVARAQTEPGKRYSGSLLLTTLNNLLSAGHITLSQYLKRLPDGILPDRECLLAEVMEKEGKEKTHGM